MYTFSAGIVKLEDTPEGSTLTVEKLQETNRGEYTCKAIMDTVNSTVRSKASLMIAVLPRKCNVFCHPVTRSHSKLLRNEHVTLEVCQGTTIHPYNYMHLNKYEGNSLCQLYSIHTYSFDCNLMWNGVAEVVDVRHYRWKHIALYQRHIQVQDWLLYQQPVQVWWPWGLSSRWLRWGWGTLRSVLSHQL